MAALGATGVNGGVSNKGLVLAAMVFAVAMTFIDLQHAERDDPGLSDGSRFSARS